MSQDLCPCGCGRPRLYPVGLTREESRFVLRLLSYWPWQSRELAQSIRAKIEKAL